MELHRAKKSLRIILNKDKKHLMLADAKKIFTIFWHFNTSAVNFISGFSVVVPAEAENKYFIALHFWENRNAAHKTDII